MKTTLKTLLMAFAAGAVMTSCQKDDNITTPGQPSTMQELNIPQGFKFNTQREVNLDLQIRDVANVPYRGVAFDILSKPLDLGGVVLASGRADMNGRFVGTVNLPTYFDEVVLQVYGASVPANLVMPVTNTNLNFTVGGSSPSSLVSYEVAYPNAYNNLRILAGARTENTYLTKVSYRLGTFNNDGRPNYLETINDPMPQQFLNNINTNLPESRPVPSFNPEYLDDRYERNINITELSDVFVTFVTEGAGYRNALFYYVYDKNNPPATANDIDSLIAVFPNASLAGSGGSMVAGNKVNIGRFPANKTIGFALIADGWRGGPRVAAGNWIVYSNKNFNTAVTNPNNRQQTVVLYDAQTQRFIFGMEDILRNGSSDQDFNDCVFYVTSNPVRAIDTTNIIVTRPAVDTDNDGVFDTFDEYPTDPTKAYNNYSPSINGNSTLAFEDLWPSQGDYDFNDLVVAYRFNRVTNAQNNVVELQGKVWLKAIGASFKNGFGIELGNVAPNQVASVSGLRRSETYINDASNGLEQGQSKATIVVFDNAFSVLRPVGAGFVNTEVGRPKSNSDTINFVVRFTNPISQNTLGTAPFNPFLIQNGNRGVEVHLPDRAPTSLANQNLLGTNADKSVAANGIYYRTSNRLPWAIDIAGDFAYPVEKVAIINAHLRFAAWAQSGGTQFRDWFLNNSGYRNNTNIYR